MKEKEARADEGESNRKCGNVDLERGDRVD